MQTQNILHHNIKGISFEDWASASILLSRWFSVDNILNILGIELPVWDECSEKLNGREKAKKQLQSDILTNTNKWQRHWKDYYKD